MSLTQRKAGSRFRLLPYQIPATLFRLWQRVTNDGATTGDPASGPGSTTTAHDPGVRLSRRPLGNRRRVDESSTCDPSSSSVGPRLPRVGSQTRIKVKRPHRVGVADVRTQLQQRNAWRKERSFRILEQDHPPQRSQQSQPQAGSTTSTASAGQNLDARSNRRDFPALAKEVRRAFAVTTNVPITDEEWVFNKELGNLCLEHVQATRVVDPERANEIETAFAEHKTQDEREVFLSMLEKGRKQVDEIMRRREVENREREEKARAKEQERMRKEEEENRRAMKKEIKLEEDESLHKARIQMAEARRSLATERLAQQERERLARLEEEARLAQQREEECRIRFEREAEQQRRLFEEAETARRAAEIRAKEEAHARQVAEEQARAYVEDQARLKAEMDNMARLEMEARVRSREQEEKLRKHVEEYERLQAEYEARVKAQIAAEEVFVAQARAQWEYFVRQQQQQQQPVHGFRDFFYAPREDWIDTDILMRDPSFMTSGSLADVSMAYIPPSDPPAPRPPSPPHYTPPPPPRTAQGWFALYESRWEEIRSTTTTTSSPLSFAHFPWPVFRLITSLEELDEGDIKAFFTKKYSRSEKLNKSWREELRRWHTDKFNLFAMRIRPEELAEVQEGFSRCIKVMTVFQSERNMNMMVY